MTENRQLRIESDADSTTIALPHFQRAAEMVLGELTDTIRNAKGPHALISVQFNHG